MFVIVMMVVVILVVLNIYMYVFVAEWGDMFEQECPSGQTVLQSMMHDQPPRGAH